MNLATETLSKLKDINKDSFDIAAIFDVRTGAKMSVSDFFHTANRVYDSGYGAAEVNPSLNILFKDGSWLERAEYDGAEWWAYRCTPTIPIAEPDTPPLALFNNYG